jgi:hypothetical protein
MRSSDLPNTNTIDQNELWTAAPERGREADVLHQLVPMRSVPQPVLKVRGLGTARRTILSLSLCFPRSPLSFSRSPRDLSRARRATPALTARGAVGAGGARRAGSSACRHGEGAGPIHLRVGEWVDACTFLRLRHLRCG